jgi:hypothetical protein
MYHIRDDHIDVLKNKYRYFMCNSNPLEESSNNSDLVDFDSELDITTGWCIKKYAKKKQVEF